MVRETRGDRKLEVSRNTQVSLLLSDLLQALGGILDFKWVAQGSVTCGSSCTAQGSFKRLACIAVLKLFVLGVIKQLGETGVSLATLESIYVYVFEMWEYSRVLV